MKTKPPESKPKHVISTLERRKELRANEKYLIDEIFPCAQLHLFSGASGGGKSTLLYQWLHDWEQGLPILNRASHPCSWMMITYDRGLLDTDKTLRKLGFGEWDLPLYAFEDLYRSGLEPDLIGVCKQFFHSVDLFVIEGIHSFIPDPKPKQSQNKCEQMWVARLRSEILQHGKTIIGTTHATKSSSRELATRTSVLGGASLVGGCGTLVLFDDPPHVKQARQGMRRLETGEKVVSILPREIAPFHVNYCRDENGRLVQFEKDVRDICSDSSRFGTRIEGFDVMADLIENLQPGDQINRKLIESSAEGIGWSRATTTRWISEQIDKGRLKRLEKKGIYARSYGAN